MSTGLQSSVTSVRRAATGACQACATVKLCTVCGVVTSRAGSRCTDHARQSNRSRHNALYSTRAWQRLSARVLRAWRGEHGDWCPGYERPAHPAADLTVDHVMPLAAGGAPFDIANTAVLCRSCNSTKGASTDTSGSSLGACVGNRGAVVWAADHRASRASRVDLRAGIWRGGTGGGAPGTHARAPDKAGRSRNPGPGRTRAARPLVKSLPRL